MRIDYVEDRALKMETENYIMSFKRWVTDKYDINQVPIEVLTAFEELACAAQNMVEADLELRKLLTS